METVVAFGKIKSALEGRVAALADDETLVPWCAELWRRAAAHEAAEAVVFEGTAKVAEGLFARGQSPVAATELLLYAGTMLLEAAEAPGGLDAAGVAALRALACRAAVAVGRQVEEVVSGRRGLWLSFFVHELKNPLNTILNALWLIRERGPEAPQAGRFIELSERAVKKLEERIRDLRGLDQQLGSIPPGWESFLADKRP